MADSNQVDEKVVRRLMNKIIIQENRNNKGKIGLADGYGNQKDD